MDAAEPVAAGGRRAWISPTAQCGTSELLVGRLVAICAFRDDRRKRGIARNGFRTETCAGRFYLLLQESGKPISIEAGCNRRQILDNSGPRSTYEPSSSPEEACIHCDRQARRARLGVDGGDALLVSRRRTRRTSGAFWINEDLSAGGKNRIRGGGDLLQRLPAPGPVNCDLFRDDEIEAKQRDIGQLPFKDNGEIGGVFEKGESLEKGLMLGCDENPTMWDVLDAAVFHLEPTNMLEKPDRNRPPDRGKRKYSSPAAKNHR